MTEKGKKCDLDKLLAKGKKTTIDPYSKSGKERLSKANCDITPISADGETVFLIGDSVTKHLKLAKGYFTIKKRYDEGKDTWTSGFSSIKNFEGDKVLILDRAGPKQMGLLVSPEKSALISRALEKVRPTNG